MKISHSLKKAMAIERIYLLFLRKLRIKDWGRSPGLFDFCRPSQLRGTNGGDLQKLFHCSAAKFKLTVAGTAPVLHRIPF